MRAVPKITIDFGNGKIITRTVNGNVATYICTSDGSVIDVLPGIYDQERYVAALAAIRDRYSDLTSDSELLNQKLIAYHSLAPPAPKAVLMKADAESSPDAVPGLRQMGSRERLALKQALESDSLLNESERRPLIHAFLRESLVTSNKLLKPDDMKHWLYREVLHADLDDPYLGFNRVLTQTYPFDDFGG